MGEFSKVEGYKTKKEKNQPYFYTLTMITWNKKENIVSFVITQKNMKCLGKNLTKYIWN